MEKVDISKLKREDFAKELPQMVQQLDAYRQGSQNKKPVDITLGELTTGKWGITQDELFEKFLLRRRHAPALRQRCSGAGLCDGI